MKMRYGKIAIASTTLTLAMILSVDWSGQGSVSLSVQGAQARVGRPLTPVSVAGVARRHNRRAAYGYGAGVVGAGVVTAAAVAATSPWGYHAGHDAYGHPYHEGSYEAAYAEASPTWGGGYYASSPWGYYECRLPHPYECQPYSHIGWYHY
jgi:hypothetical protein